MRYQQLGEQDGIGATMHRLDLAGKTIIVDCGLGTGIDADGVKKQDIPAGNFLAGQFVDAIIITHAHVDHIGAIPRLAAEHPEARIFVSVKTLEAAHIVFDDTYKVSCAEIDVAKEEGRVPPDIVFDDDDIEAFFSRQIDVVDLPSWITPWGGWKFGFHSSGHDVGAMMVFIATSGERPVFLTGDVCAHDQETVKGVMLPETNFFLQGGFDMSQAVMITEATYGADNLGHPRVLEKENFIQALRLVEKRGGVVLCPAFAKNRATNIALVMVSAGIIPHIDGLARRMMIAEIGKDATDKLLRERKIVFVEAGREGYFHRYGLDKGQDACGVGFTPIIASSATLDQGAAAGHAVRILRDPNNAVMFTGHMFPGTAAAAITKMDKGWTIWLNDGPNVRRKVEVNCEVFRFDFSAHDRRPAILQRITKAFPAALVLHHCSPEAYQAVSADIGNFRISAEIHHGGQMKEIQL